MILSARRRSRLLSVPLVALLATATALSVGSPSLAQVPTRYMAPGATVQLLPTTECGLASGATVVQPADAGTVDIGANGCGLSFTAAPGYSGAASAGVSNVRFNIYVDGIGQSLVQGDIKVFSLPPPSSCVTPAGGEILPVFPPEAGSVTIGPNGCGLVFTASRTYVGIFVVGFSYPGGNTVQFTGFVVGLPPIFVGQTASANGSFTPVAAPPPPGPCLVITANSVVPFGDVTIGGGYKETPAPPNVFGCAPASVTQDVLVQATNAQNGVTNLAVDSCSQVAGCAPGEGTYSVAILDAPLIVRSTPSVWLDARAGDAGAVPQLAVKMPATLAPTLVGSLFTFDVTFTAVVD